MNQQMHPPLIIDGAHVLWWAWAGDEPFGMCSGIEVYGFAICRCDSGALYRFSCDREWQTVNDAPFDDEEEAKTGIPANYLGSASRIHWHHSAPNPKNE